jgi:putative spermidine/putrescine transport system substrate-binding protein
MKVKSRLAIPLAVALLAVAACGGGSDDKASGGSGPSGGSGGGGSVTYVGYGGSGQEAISKAWLDPWAKEAGTKVNLDDPFEPAKAIQMVKANRTVWDVAQGGLDFGLENNPNLENIDCSIVACDEFKGGPFPVMKQGVPLFVFAITLGYNTDKIKGDVPTGMDALFDTQKYPGKRDLDALNGLQGILEVALVADGVDRDKLYPLDVPRALRKLDSIKKDIVAFKDNAQCINDISSGEAVMGTCYNGRITLAKEAGQPVEVAWGQQVQFCDYLFIPKGAKNAANAQKLIAYIASSKNNGNIADYIPYSPANPNATGAGKYAKDTPIPNVKTGKDAPIFIDPQWWNDNRTTVVEQVSRWLGS